MIADFLPPHEPERGRFKIALVGGAASVALALVVVVIFALFDDRLYGFDVKTCPTASSS